MIYDRLPESLKLGGEESTGRVLAGLNFTPSIDSFLLSGGTISWSFGNLEVEEAEFRSEVLPSEFILGITASPSSEVGESYLEDVPPSLETVKISGDFLEKNSRPENLYDPGSIYDPGFTGSEITLEAQGNFTKIRLRTPTTVSYEGTDFTPDSQGWVEISVFTDSGKVKLSTGVVNELLVSGLFLSSLDRIQYKLFLQPVGRSQTYEPLQETKNLYLIGYSYQRGFFLVRDLREFTEAEYIDLARVLTKSYDDRLDEIYEIADKYIPNYMAADTAYLGEYNEQ